MFYWIFKILSTSEIHSALSGLFWNQKYLAKFSILPVRKHPNLSWMNGESLRFVYNTTVWNSQSNFMFNLADK